MSELRCRFRVQGLGLRVQGLYSSLNPNLRYDSSFHSLYHRNFGGYKRYRAKGLPVDPMTDSVCQHIGPFNWGCMGDIQGLVHRIEKRTEIPET